MTQPETTREFLETVDVFAELKMFLMLTNSVMGAIETAVTNSLQDNLFFKHNRPAMAKTHLSLPEPKSGKRFLLTYKNA